MGRRDRLHDNAGCNRANLARARFWPDDTLANRRPEPFESPAALRRKPVEPAADADIIAPQRRAPKKQNPHESRKEGETQRAGNGQTGSHIPLDIRDLAGEGHDAGDEGEDDPIEKALDRRRHEDTSQAQAFQAGDQPRAYQWTDADRNEGRDPIAGENRGEEPETRNRLQIEKYLTPFPSPDELFEKNRSGQGDKPDRFCSPYGGEKNSNVEITVEPEQDDDRDRGAHNGKYPFGENSGANVPL